MEYLLFIFSSFVTILINRRKDLFSEVFNQILVVRLDHIGDLACTLYAINSIKKKYQTAKVTALIGEWNNDVLKNNPNIDEILIYNSRTFSRKMGNVFSLKQRWALGKTLRMRNFDLVIGFRDDFFTILLSLFICPRARIDRGTVRLTKKLKLLNREWFKGTFQSSFHEIETNDSIVSLVGIHSVLKNQKIVFCSQEEYKWLDNFLEQKRLERNHYIVLHPGASWKYRRWDVHNFVSVGNFIFNNYKLKSIIIGDQNEMELGEKIYNLSPEIFINVVGKTTLREITLFISNARLFICNDSGPMHLSAIMGVPTIALLGPQDISRFGPRGENIFYFHRKLECYPCKQIDCKYPYHPCVDHITVAEVIEGIQQMLCRPYTISGVQDSFKLNKF